MKKRLLASLLSFVLLLTLLPMGVLAADDEASISINGEEAVNMSLADALAAANSAADGCTVTITLLKDLQLDNWTAVSFSNNITFVLDGAGKKITGLNAPIFGHMNAPGQEIVTITNLNIDEPNITGGGENGTAAALVGWLEGHDSNDKLTIKNCHVSNGNISGGYTGSFVGYSADDATLAIEECSVENMTLVGSNSVGTFIGHSYCNTTITDGAIKGTNSIECTDENSTRPDKAGLVVGRINLRVVSIDVTIEGNSTLEPAGEYEQRAIGNTPGGTAIITGGSYPADPRVTNGGLNDHVTIGEGLTLVGTSEDWTIYDGTEEEDIALAAGDQIINGDSTVTVPSNVDSITLGADAIGSVTDDGNGNITLPIGTEITANGRTWIANSDTITLGADGSVTAAPEDEVIIPEEDNDPVYRIKIDAGRHGEITTKPSGASEGTTITVYVEPDKGYALDELVVTDRDGNELELKDMGDGRYRFQMPDSKVNIEASFKKAKEEVKIVLTVGSNIATVNGETVTTDVAPVIVNDRTMLPIRFIAEALGAEVEWVETERKVIITKGDTNIVIFIDGDYAYINGEAVKLDAAAFIEGNRTYLPLRFVAEALGADVVWDPDTRTVIVTGTK